MKRSEKIKRKFLYFSFFSLLSYFGILISLNVLCYGNWCRNINLLKSIKIFYEVRWMLPLSKDYFETEVVVITLIILISLFIVICLFISFSSEITREQNEDDDDLRGTSAWADIDEIKGADYLFSWKSLSDEKKGASSPSLIIGQWNDVKVKGSNAKSFKIKQNSKYLIGAKLEKKPGESPEVNHTLIFGTTGCGKGVSTIVPSLLSHKGSLICYDPAGENFRITAGWRSRVGCVQYFNPQDLKSTLHFNPLDFIKRDVNSVVNDIENLTNIIIPASADSNKDPFWDNSSKNLLFIYISYILLKNPVEKCNMFEVTRIVNILQHTEQEVEYKPSGAEDEEKEEGAILGGEKKQKQEGFIALLNKMLSDAEEMKELFEENSWKYVLADTLIIKIKNLMNAAKAENTLGSIQFVIETHLNFYSNPNLAKLMSDTSFDIDDFQFREKPLSVYFIILDKDQKRCKGFIRVFCELVLSGLKNDDNRYKKLGRHVVLFLLDEFPLLGYMETIETSIPVTRKYGVAFCLITQDLAQLEKAYSKQGCISLVNNMQITNIKRVNDVETATWVSKSIGNETRKIEKTSYSRKTGEVIAQSSSTNTQAEGRALIDPSEVKRLKVYEQIAFIQGIRDSKLAKVQWFRSSIYKQRANLDILQDAEKVERENTFTMATQEEAESDADMAFCATPDIDDFDFSSDDMNVNNNNNETVEDSGGSSNTNNSQYNWF